MDNKTHTETALAIEGMSCAACVGRVERALLAVPGVERAAVNLATEQARVLSSGTPLDALQSAVAKAGYAASLAADRPAAQAPSREGWIIALGAAATLPLVAPMLAAPFGVHWMLDGRLQWLLASVVQFWCGARFYLGTWHALKARSANMDLLVSLGTSAAYGLSTVQLLRGLPMPDLYFEGAAVVIVLVRLGKWLEGRARRQAGDAIRALQALRPEKARLLRDGVEEEIGIAWLRVGDTIAVRPGERIPADARIVQGETEADESMVTGESMPVPKGQGASVIGGSLNGTGAFNAVVSAAGAESTLARIIRAVEDAQAAKAPVQQMVDKVTAVFVPTILVIALMTLGGWYLAGAGVEKALLHAVSVLVIACPCALGLATPAAIVAGTGAAARHGILVRDPAALEALQHIDVVVFDKTGTLTQGAPVLASWRALGAHDAGQVRALAASVQRSSEHPLARAVRAAAGTADAPDESQAIPGYGTQARIGGVRYVMGNARLMARHGLDVLEPGGAHTIAWLARLDPEAMLMGEFTFEDALKPGAADAIAAVHAMGMQSVLLTGDRSASARKVADALGIVGRYPEVPPEGKAHVVATLRAAGARVAMVGDGLNDAPALAAADAGIAMGGGADAALQAAGVTLVRADPRLLPAAIDIAHRTVRKIRQNLFWAFVFNIAAIPMAAFGKLDPMLAGAMMAMSSVSVVGNALLLKRWSPTSGETT